MVAQKWSDLRFEVYPATKMSRRLELKPEVAVGERRLPVDWHNLLLSLVQLCVILWSEESDEP